jgi:hypothetical protein
MEYKYFIGIDVSKNTLDISLLVSELGSAKHLQVSNSDNGILTMLK